MHNLRLCSLLLLALGQLPASGAVSLDRPWNEEIIYFVMTDRFLDGDQTNNRPPGSEPSLYDPKQEDIDLYHGGDLRGLEIALEAGYFNELGVTALWITPPVRNVWYSAFDSNDAPKTGYHGYWTQDFLDIDPHLTSSHSLDGKRAYPETREGRLQHYRDFIALAHEKGIKVIQDIVCNHTGPVFFYDANHNGRFDRSNKEEWIQPFLEDAQHTNTIWAETQEWNQAPAQPTESLRLLGHDVSLQGTLGRFDSYGRRGMSPGSLSASNGEEVDCDFLAMRDLDTSPDSPHFDALVDDFVAIYAFYAEVIGVDGFRIDTVKHVHQEFWDAFVERLRARLGPERSSELILFGEVYDGNPETLGRYTYRTDWPENPAPSIDSLLNFQLCYATRAYLRTGSEAFGNAQGIEDAIRALSQETPQGMLRPFYNQTAGPDGLNASQKIVNFVENHDGINRFRVRGVSERRHFLANALALLMPGIACIYYGSETALQDNEAHPHEDAETGRLTYIPSGSAERLFSHQENPHFQAISDLIRLRREHPALKGFGVHSLWVDSPEAANDDGIFVFVRSGNSGDALIIVINASTEASETTIPGHWMPLVDAGGAPLLANGDQIDPLNHSYWTGEEAPKLEVRWHSGVPRARIQAGPESLNIFQIVRSECSDK